MLLPGIIILLSALLYFAGLITALVGAVKTIIAAFRQSVFWGLAYLFIPLAALLFWIRHWSEAREGVILRFKGLGLALIACLGFYCAYLAAPENVQASFIKGFHHGFDASRNQPEPAPVSQPLQIAHEDVKNAQAETVVLETKANQTYLQLTEKRKTLDTKNAVAVHAFNEEAANYAKIKTRLAEQQKELARVKKQEQLLEDQAAAIANNKDSGIVIYSTNWCPSCKAAKEYFSRRNIPYREIDVEHSPEGAAEFQRLGGNGVPLIVIKGDKMTGFSPAWVEQHLAN